MVNTDKLVHHVPKQVLQDELEQAIETRRKAANVSCDPVTLERELTGLALSGGGIRSAAFNLGVLQAFANRKLMRHIDYLSTVSGGGYIGSWFSSLVHRAYAADGDKAEHRVLRSLGSSPGKPQSEAVIKLARNGKYLDRLTKVWNHFSIGLVYNNLAIFSILAFACLAIAYCWRALDSHYVVYWTFYKWELPFLGVEWPQYWLNETVRKVLPAGVMGVLWFGVWCMAHCCALRKSNLSCVVATLVGGVGLLLALAAVTCLLWLTWYVGWGTHGTLFFLVPAWLAFVGFFLWKVKKPSKEVALASIADGLFVLTLVLLAIGIVVVLSTPNANLVLGRAPDKNETFGSFKNIVYPLLGLLVTALMPFLRPKQLLQSGLNPKNAWEGRIFTVATSALLFGVPLSLIWLFSHHGCSEYLRQAPQLGPDLPKEHRAYFEAELRNLDKRSDSPRSPRIASEPLNVEQSLPTPNEPDAARKLQPSDIANISRFYQRTQYGTIGQFIHCAVASACEKDREVADFWPKHSTEAPKALKNIQSVHKTMIRKDQIAKETIFAALNLHVIHDGRFTRCFWDTATNNGQVEFDKSELFRTRISHHAKAAEIAQLMEVARQLGFQFDYAIARLNRLLLEAYFPQDVYSSARIHRGNVIDEDQGWREWFLFWMFWAMLVAMVVVNLNLTSMHSFYRERLADAFICEKESPLPLNKLNTTAAGFPYHLLSATLNHQPSNDKPSRLDGENLGQTRTTGFLMSPMYCGYGTKLANFERTKKYGGGKLELADAMAVSGAAVSPLQISSWFIIALMVIFNARTGQWMPRPRLHNGLLWRLLRRRARRFLRHTVQSLTRHSGSSRDTGTTPCGIPSIAHGDRPVEASAGESLLDHTLNGVSESGSTATAEFTHVSSSSSARTNGDIVQAGGATSTTALVEAPPVTDATLTDTAPLGLSKAVTEKALPLSRTAEKAEHTETQAKTIHARLRSVVNSIDEYRADFAALLSTRLAGMNGPTLVGLGLHLLAHRDKRPSYFVSDGGHHENLGLWPLLERRCRLIITSDASEDNTSGFADLLRVIRRARFEAGIEIKSPEVSGSSNTRGSLPGEQDEPFTDLLRLLRSVAEPRDGTADKQAAEEGTLGTYRRSRRHFVLARIHYPDADPGYLIYVKPTLTGDEPADVQAYAAQNADFPHHPTPDQLYDEDRFESYRQLGEHIGNRLCDELDDGADPHRSPTEPLLPFTPSDWETLLQKSLGARQRKSLLEEKKEKLRQPATP